MYWAEAFVGRSWVPLDPVGGYLGWLPNTYLALYRNDLPLLGHTRQVSVDYSLCHSTAHSECRPGPRGHAPAG